MECQGGLFFTLNKSSTAMNVSLHSISSLVLFPIILKAFCSCVMCFSFVQMILMSGLSRTALEDLSSDKLFEERIPHICNILKFAVLKKDHSLMATGGPCDPTDGMDPSVDQSSLITTMLRCVSSLVRFCHSFLPCIHCLEA